MRTRARLLSNWTTFLSILSLFSSSTTPFIPELPSSYFMIHEPTAAAITLSHRPSLLGYSFNKAIASLLTAPSLHFVTTENNAETRPLSVSSAGKHPANPATNQQSEEIP
ncbi:hypothetical protein G7Y89_g4927 [Cudoniella acicularis]|uniref:Uncharacterized protein n=1 Tax=Cudoniella acicularis TaxID=354080 RepID=A0A8H4RNG5_9HELO|nr:hypothetical protein G7Y89_g4927 [Cudoniella acicularis]